MQPKILITGAAGYIGGSIVADFIAGKTPLIDKEYVFAAVRSEEQGKALAKLGINVLQVDLTKEEDVVEIISRNEINIAIHCASSRNPHLALNLIIALSKQKEASGKETYFIHTSGMSAFCETTGWPANVTKDTGPIFETEKQLADSFPLRKTDVAVVESAQAQGVTSFVVVPCYVYGKGSGEWNQLSVVFPIIVKASISDKKVQKFSRNNKAPAVHISDLTGLYAQIVGNIIRGQAIPHGTQGYYFALAHHLMMWDVLDRLAAALKARGLITESDVRVWPSNEAVAKAYGVPVQFVDPLWNAIGNITAERPHQIGWKPTWDEERFLENIDDEIDAVVELGKAKSSLIDSLFESVKKG